MFAAKFHQSGLIVTEQFCCQNPNLTSTKVGFDMKMTLQTPPTHRNFSGTSRRARELKFGTDIH